MVDIEILRVLVGGRKPDNPAVIVSTLSTSHVTVAQTVEMFLAPTGFCLAGIQK